MDSIDEISDAITISAAIDDSIHGIDTRVDDFTASVPLKRVPNADVFEASRAGDVKRLKYLLESGVNVNARDGWDSAALYYACLAGHLHAARMLLESGAICAEQTFDGDRCHYAALNLNVRRLLKAFEARPPPLAPLQAALRETFLSSVANRIDFDSHFSGHGGSADSGFPPDITFHIQGRHIEAHRAILSARSPFFKHKFETDWNGRGEIKLSKQKLSYPALYSLIHFFYSDRLEIAVGDMEDLVRICKVCGCRELQKHIEKEIIHQKYAEYKSLTDADSSQKRFITQGSSLPEEDRLPYSLLRILQISLNNSTSFTSGGCVERIEQRIDRELVNGSYDIFSDVLVGVGKAIFPCHQVVLASRSAYFKARLTHIDGFIDNKSTSCYKLPFIVEQDLSVEGFQKLIEYMYTDRVSFLNPDLAEELFDAASRYLLFPMKRAVSDALMPHLETLAPAELCNWLILSDIYGVSKIREYCLDVMACHFEILENTRELREVLLAVPPPSGDNSLRTSIPKGPGECTAGGGEGNILDDLREKWLEFEAGGLDTRDESALLFDERLLSLIQMARQEDHLLLKS